MTYISETCHTAKPVSRSFLSGLRHLLAVRRERAQLSKLSDTQLEDIGISRADAANESARTFWDAPQSWLR